MSMFARYAPRGRPPDKMDLLREQLARSLKLMGQHSGMQLTEPKDFHEDMNYVHPNDQSWSYGDYHPSQGGYNYYTEGHSPSIFLDEPLYGNMKPTLEETLATFMEQTEACMRKPEACVNPSPQLCRSEPIMEPQGNVEYVNYIQQVDQDGAIDGYYLNQTGSNDYSLTRSTQNSSFGYSDHAQQPSHDFSISYGVIEEPKKNSTDELLISFIGKTEAYIESSSQRLDKLEQTMEELSSHMKNMATQMSQIVHAVTIQQQPVQFQEQTIVHPKECNGIGLNSGISQELLSIPERQSKINHGEDDKGVADEEKKETEEEVTARMKKKRPRKKNKVAKMSGVLLFQSSMVSRWMKQMDRLIHAIVAKSNDADSIIRFRIN